MKRIHYIGLIFLSSIFACSDASVVNKDDTAPKLPVEPYDYNLLRLPFGTNKGNMLDDFTFNEGNIEFTKEKTEITPWGATLGRVLFYDKKLSLNNTIACASCHHQDKAFADGQQFSTGFEGRITTRNSMAIVNPILQNNLFWDSRSKTIHDLSLKPVKNHIEMGMENMDRLVEKIENTPYYKGLFEKAYGKFEVNPENISNAISQFVASITTNRSRFDEALILNFSNFNDLELLGMNLFKSDRAKCSSCHGGNNFSALDGPLDPYGGGGSTTGDLRGATNIGLDLVYKDNGLGNGNFRIPSLRNIALTAPYMHDGRFKTLEEVINHYSDDVKPHPKLDVKLTDGKGNVKPLKLTSIEKKALVAFLKTLTDEEMIHDPKYSNPFKS